MQKGFAQLFLIVLVIGLGIGGIYFYQSIRNDPLQNPKLNISSDSEIKDYSNPLGFEFKYPNDLTVKEDSEEEFNKRGNGNYRKNFKSYITYEPGKFLGAAVVLDKSNSFDTNPFTIWVFDNPNGLSINDWYKKYWYYPFVWGDYTSRKESVAPTQEATISGSLGKSGVVNYNEGKPKFIYLSFDKKIYLIRVIGDTGDQILSSYKFPTEETKKEEAKNTTGCKIGGCSRQLCLEEDKSGISTCEYLAEYGCYRNAICQRQSDGKCGWIQTEELARCLKEVRLK